MWDGWVGHEIHREGGVLNILMSQVRYSVLSSDKLLSTGFAFWIIWEKACFVGSCFGRKHFSSIENTGNLVCFFSWN